MPWLLGLSLGLGYRRRQRLSRYAGAYFETSHGPQILFHQYPLLACPNSIAAWLIREL